MNQYFDKKTDKYYITIIADIPNCLPSSIINFRIYSIIDYNMDEIRDPNIDNSSYIFRLSKRSFNKKMLFKFSFDKNEFEKIKLFKFGLCEEQIRWIFNDIIVENNFFIEKKEKEDYDLISYDIINNYDKNISEENSTLDSSSYNNHELKNKLCINSHDEFFINKNQVEEYPKEKVLEEKVLEEEEPKEENLKEEVLKEEPKENIINKKENIWIHIIDLSTIDDERSTFKYINQISFGRGKQRFFIKDSDDISIDFSKYDYVEKFNSDEEIESNLISLNPSKITFSEENLNINLLNIVKRIIK